MTFSMHVALSETKYWIRFHVSANQISCIWYAGLPAYVNFAMQKYAQRILSTSSLKMKNAFNSKMKIG